MKAVKNLVLSNRFLLRIVMYFHQRRLKSTKNAAFGSRVLIGTSTICEGYNTFGDNTGITNSYVGYGTYLSENNYFSRARIGRFTSVGPNVKCIFGRHPSNTFVSTHPSFFSKNHNAVRFSFTKEQLFEEFAGPRDEEGYSILIGNDVWIGANVSIMNGIEIGDGAIIAANALVNKDVPPYAIYGGVPAKHIKWRFTEQEIEFLVKFKWWDKDIAWIKKNSDKFKDIKLFKQSFGHV